MPTSPGNRTALWHHEQVDERAGISAPDHELHKYKVVTTNQLPIFGNFRRYYHIRNPLMSRESGHTCIETHPNDVQSHPALSLDTRLAHILTYLEKRCATREELDRSGRGKGFIRDVLDIGCNSGKVTIQMAQSLPILANRLGHSSSSIRVTGVDIDPSLVQEAKKAATAARSMCNLSLMLSGFAETVYQERGVVKCLPIESIYFPSTFPTLFGTIPGVPIVEYPSPPPSKKVKKLEERATGTDDAPLISRLQPPYLEFYAGDWVNLEGAQHQGHFAYSADDILGIHEKDLNQYDLILALSLTKWIHIHHGDAGLARFFARISQNLRPGGFLILERQERKSYDQARRMTPETKQKVQSLKMRPEGDFDWLLDRVGLKFVEKIGDGVGTGFLRPLEVFEKDAHTDKMIEILVESLLRTSPDAGCIVTFPWVTRASSASSPAIGPSGSNSEN